MKIWTNGCFDILHIGHIALFKYARSLGEELIVGIDSDEKVRKDKGEDRPINKLEDRMFVLDAIEYIDIVLEFDSTDELEWLIKDIKETKYMKEYIQSKQLFEKLKYDKTKTLEGNFILNGIQVVQNKPKNRYIYIIATKKQKTDILKNLKYEIQPYPKGQNKRYDASYQPTTQNKLF